MKNRTIPDNADTLEPGHYFASLGEAPFELPVLCSGGGHCVTGDPDYRYHGMLRGREEFCFWQYTISGGIALECDGARRIVAPGEAMLLAVPEEHCFYLPSECGHWDSIYLILSGYDCRRLVNELRRIYGSHFQVAPAAESLRMARERLKLLERGEEVSSFDAADFGFRFLMALAKELAAERNAEPAFMTKVRLLVRDKPHTGVAGMCRASGYSKLYFERLFKRFAGVTPAAYLAEQRMNHAMELLRHTMLPVKDIARRCGCRDCAYFCRIFRKRFQVPPGQWRKSTGN